jgi:hypothetical protein
MPDAPLLPVSKSAVPAPRESLPGPTLAPFQKAGKGAEAAAQEFSPLPTAFPASAISQAASKSDKAFQKGCSCSGSRNTRAAIAQAESKEHRAPSVSVWKVESARPYFKST